MPEEDRSLVSFGDDDEPEVSPRMDLQSRANEATVNKTTALQIGISFEVKRGGNCT
jgi:hypothetical protein